MVCDSLEKLEENILFIVFFFLIAQRHFHLLFLERKREGERKTLMQKH